MDLAAKLALRPLHHDKIAVDADINAFRQLDRLISNA
jgi:hypothetical protein